VRLLFVPVVQLDLMESHQNVRLVQGIVKPVLPRTLVKVV
jgi:hypothetical protein